MPLCDRWNACLEIGQHRNFLNLFYFSDDRSSLTKRCLQRDIAYFLTNKIIPTYRLVPIISLNLRRNTFNELSLDLSKRISNAFR